MVTSRIETLVAMNKSKTRDNPTVEWNGINWRKAERLKFKLQKRIDRASERGDVKHKHCHDTKTENDGS